MAYTLPSICAKESNFKKYVVLDLFRLEPVVQLHRASGSVLLGVATNHGYKFCNIIMLYAEWNVTHAEVSNKALNRI